MDMVLRISSERTRTPLASDFLLVDLTRSCIGGVQNGAVEDRKLVWMFYLFLFFILIANVALLDLTIFNGYPS